MDQAHGTGFQIVVIPGGLADVENALPACGNDELKQQSHDRPDAFGGFDCSPELAQLRIRKRPGSGCRYLLDYNYGGRVAH
ncbi:hypothetical protein D3C87_1648570 [compost metagenome]